MPRMAEVVSLTVKVTKAEAGTFAEAAKVAQYKVQSLVGGAMFVGERTKVRAEGSSWRMTYNVRVTKV